MNRLVKIVLGVLVVLALAVGYVLTPPSPEPDGTISKSLYKPGDLGVVEESVDLVDTSRRTAENGEYAGAGERRLVGSLWYPQQKAGKPFPLIVYSHGFMSSPAEAGYLVDFLVPKGYVMVAVNYPLTNGAAPGGPNVRDVVNQPGDVSFVLDKLLARNSNETDPLNGMIDPDRIAFSGLSLGGLTTILATYHGAMRDPRVKASAAIAGPSAYFGRDFYSTTDIPFLMIAGSTDAIVTYKDNAEPIPDRVNNSTLVTIEDGSHVGFASMAKTLFRWSKHPDETVCPMLVANVNREGDTGGPLFEPDPTLGIVSTQAVPCANKNFERAMRPADQQMLTRLALYAFLESVFAKDAERREEMSAYLAGKIASENEGVMIALSN